MADRHFRSHPRGAEHPPLTASRRGDGRYKKGIKAGNSLHPPQLWALRTIKRLDEVQEGEFTAAKRRSVVEIKDRSQGGGGGKSKV